MVFVKTRIILVLIILAIGMFVHLYNSFTVEKKENIPSPDKPSISDSKMFQTSDKIPYQEKQLLNYKKVTNGSD